MTFWTQLKLVKSIYTKCHTFKMPTIQTRSLLRSLTTEHIAKCFNQTFSEGSTVGCFLKNRQPLFWLARVCSILLKTNSHEILLSVSKYLGTFSTNKLFAPKGLMTYPPLNIILSTLWIPEMKRAGKSRICIMGKRCCQRARLALQQLFLTQILLTFPTSIKGG